MKRLAAAMSLLVFTMAYLRAQEQSAVKQFFPMRAGTYWTYQGTVRWYDSEKDQPASQKVTWKMSVEKVIHKDGLSALIVAGFPADLDWSSGAPESNPWLILEDDKHQVFRVNLGPNYDLAKLDRADAPFARFLDDDALLFQWPLRKGAKFCDAESKRRDDNLYCWIVSDAVTKKVESVAGLTPEEKSVFVLQYRSLPDDTTMELLPGVGLLSYEYHHHGTVADTELRLVEFHPAPETHDAQGLKP